MYPISKDPQLCGLFQYTKEVVIEFGHWTRYVVYISVIVFYRANGLSGVILSLIYPISKDPRLCGLFQYTREVVIGHWTRYVVYVSVIVPVVYLVSTYLSCTLFLRTHDCEDSFSTPKKL